MEAVTWVFESKGGDSNLMDTHNNRIGARIGSATEHFQDLEPAVLSHAFAQGLYGLGLVTGRFKGGYKVKW